MALPLRVLVLLRSAQRRPLFARVLAEEGFPLVDGAALTSDSVVELIVTDHLDWPPLPSPLAELRLRGLVGVVQCGGPAGADVVLPEDATPRELVLACRLLGEVVRLRRARARERGERRQLERLAEHDALSGVANRRGWTRELQRRIALPAAAPLTLVLLDVDHFKLLNDQHGHPAADRVLQAIGGALVASLRSKDFVARLGGDEFGLLVSGVDAVVARRLVQRVRRAAGTAATEAAGTPVTLSAGFAQAPPLRCSSEELYESADQALRAAKAAGRNCICGAEP